MYTLFTDETNTSPGPNVKFFVYGGLLIPNRSLTDLHLRIQEIRDNSGFYQSNELKFDSRSKPDHVSKGVFAEVKNQVINSCIDFGCKFIAMFILHDIINNQSPEQRISWGANCLIKSFNEFLKNQENEYGFVVADRFNNDLTILKEKFLRGLEHYDGRFYRPDRILGFSTSCSGCSHFSSAADIVIGSFRYCINKPENEDAARDMYHNIITLQYSVTEHPFEVRNPVYKKEYDDLKERLSELKIIQTEDIPF